MANTSKSQNTRYPSEYRAPKERTNFQLPTCPGSPSYQLRHAIKWHVSVADFCKAGTAKK